MLTAMAADQLHSFGLIDAAASLAGAGPEAGKASVAPALAPQLAELRTLTSAHGSSVRLALGKYRKGIIDQQLVLRRLADNAIDLFASTCVLSRASMAAAKRVDSAAHETVLAKLFCDKASRRIRGRLSELSGQGTASQEDKYIATIADETVARGSYIPTHPLRL
jgi:acyl-CoA dehydrogenase family member 9